MKCLLIGEKLGHSLSLPIHQSLGLYEYELCPLAPEDLHEFMTKRAFDGINVTIPYKKDVIPYCHEISESAKLCGAVNTITNRDGRLYGDNTDFMGLLALLEKAKITVTGKKVLILGSGGTSGTALALCRHLKAFSVYRVSRSGKDGCITYEEAREKKDTEIILNTTPCGMFPNMENSPVSLEDFPCLEGVADAIYNPLSSRLIVEARKKSIPAEGGLYMLVAQGIYAAECWTGRHDLRDRIDSVYENLLREKKNVVLIGMPGCGKSTLGVRLAEKLKKNVL